MEVIPVHMYTAEQCLKELWSVSYMPEMHFSVSLGPEKECFVFDTDGEPVDLTLPEHQEVIGRTPNVLNAGTDLGENQFEIAFNPQHSIRQYIDTLLEVFQYLTNTRYTRDWLYQFSGTAKKTIGAVSTPRYNAAIAALQEEDSEKGKRTIACMTSYSALQINVGTSHIGGDFSEQVKKIAYAFANWGIPLAIYFEKKNNDLKSVRLGDAYSFTGAARGIRYMDWEFCSQLEEEMYKVPRLLRSIPGGRYTYCGEMTQALDALHTGTIYWPARPQGIGDKVASRVEIRGLSAMPPALSVQAMNVVNQLVTYILDTHADNLPVLPENDWWYLQRKENERKCVSMASEFLQKLPVML